MTVNSKKIKSIAGASSNRKVDVKGTSYVHLTSGSNNQAVHAHNDVVIKRTGSWQSKSEHLPKPIRK